MNFVQELTLRALTGLPAITLPCFVLTREMEPEHSGTGRMDKDRRSRDWSDL